MQSTISQRIKNIINTQCKGKNTEFARLIGTSEANIRNYLSGKSTPKLNIITKIVNSFDVSYEWLITGEEKTRLENDSMNETEQVYNLKTDTILKSQKIPLYDNEAIAGIVPVFDDLNSQTPLDYMQIPNAPKCDGAMYAIGDSMYPIIKSGDILGYKEIKDLQNDIFWGHMYIVYIMVAGDLLRTVKYIQKGKNEQYVKLVSENRHHEPKEVRIEKIKAIAQVKITVRMN